MIGEWESQDPSKTDGTVEVSEHREGGMREAQNKDFVRELPWTIQRETVYFSTMDRDLGFTNRDEPYNINYLENVSSSYHYTKIQQILWSAPQLV